MCGIFVYFSSEFLDTDKVLRCKEALKAIDHRGPDGQGMLLLNTESGEHVFIKDEFTPAFCTSDDLLNLDVRKYNCVMAHKRLSIFDLSENGFQPMENGKNLIVFNGEIYNWAEIREELAKDKTHFKTHTDTEVILKAFEKRGNKMFHEFNGMWAMVLWDNEQRRFLISRDRYGVKPMMMKQYKDGSWIIASEEKQIISFDRVMPAVNFRNLEIFINEGHIGFDRSTFYKEINHFPAAHFTLGKPQELFKTENIKPFYSSYRGPVKYKSSQDQAAIKKFNDIFHSAVEFRLRADVAAGFSLSGGLDSSRIVYEVEAIKNYKYKPEFFSAIFPGSDVNEESSVKTIAEDLKIKPNFCYPEREFSLDDYTKLTFVLDSPVPDLSYYAQWSVSNLVHKHKKKILVVGQGADEVFAGYHHHFYRYVVAKIFSGKLSAAKLAMRQYAGLKGWDESKVKTIVKQQVVETIKTRIKKVLSFSKPGLSAVWNGYSNLEDILHADLETYQIPYFLKADDRIGMWHGFESRYPFLDYRLVDFGFSVSPDIKIRDGWQKWIIRKSFTNGPESIVWRKDKIGYKMPVHSFFENEELLKEATDKLSSEIKITTQNKYRIIAAYLWLQQYK